MKGELIIARMVINMNETRLCTIEQIEQIEQFLSASAQIDFSAHGGDLERYAHIADVFKRFGYHQRGKHDRGVLLRYPRHRSSRPVPLAAGPWSP